MATKQSPSTADKKIRISEELDTLIISMMRPQESYNAALLRLLAQAGKRKAHA